MHKFVKNFLVAVIVVMAILGFIMWNPLYMLLSIVTWTNLTIVDGEMAKLYPHQIARRSKQYFRLVNFGYFMSLIPIPGLVLLVIWPGRKSIGSVANHAWFYPSEYYMFNNTLTVPEYNLYFTPEKCWSHDMEYYSSDVTFSVMSRSRTLKLTKAPAGTLICEIVHE